MYSDEQSSTDSNSIPEEWAVDETLEFIYKQIAGNPSKLDLNILTQYMNVEKNLIEKHIIISPPYHDQRFLADIDNRLNKMIKFISQDYDLKSLDFDHIFWTYKHHRLQYVLNLIQNYLKNSKQPLSTNFTKLKLDLQNQMKISIVSKISFIFLGCCP